MQDQLKIGPSARFERLLRDVIRSQDAFILELSTQLQILALMSSVNWRCIKNQDLKRLEFKLMDPTRYHLDYR